MLNHPHRYSLKVTNCKIAFLFFFFFLVFYSFFSFASYQIGKNNCPEKLLLHILCNILIAKMMNISAIMVKVDSQDLTIDSIVSDLT